MEQWRHFILYAKGHYRRTDLFEDLKHILAEHCAIEPRHVRLFDICEILLGIFLKHSTDTQQKELLMRIFSSEHPDIKTAIEMLTGAIAILKVYDQGKELLVLGDPDPAILELS